MNRDAIHFIMVCGFFLSMVSIFIYVCWEEGEKNRGKYARLLDQCMQDGRREYECVLMLEEFR